MNVLFNSVSNSYVQVKAVIAKMIFNLPLFAVAVPAQIARLNNSSSLPNFEGLNSELNNILEKNYGLHCCKTVTFVGKVNKFG